MLRGYCGIGLYQARWDTNIGTAFRSALCFGANFLYTIGHKYKKQASDTCDSTRHLPYLHYENYDDFIQRKPKDANIVCVEITDNARDLTKFYHPKQALYLFGNETYGIHEKYLQNHLVVKIPTKLCLNVASSVGIVLYDRMLKQAK